MSYYGADSHCPTLFDTLLLSTIKHRDGPSMGERVGDCHTRSVFTSARSLVLFFRLKRCEGERQDPNELGCTYHRLMRSWMSCVDGGRIG